MRWWYKLIQKTPNSYIYAYSRECNDLDGEILYDLQTGRATMTKRSMSDFENSKSEIASLRHFYAQVVDEGFPEERYVCCG